MERVIVKLDQVITDKIITIWIGIGLLLFSLTCLASIDPELIGVWETQYTPGRVVEFKQDGTTITWEKDAVKAYLQVSTKFTFLSKEKIHTQSNNTFSPVGENKPFTYKVVSRDGRRTTLKFSPTSNNKLVIEMRKMDFNQDYKSSYQLHQNLAFDAEIRYAISTKNTSQLKKLLNSAQAGFLKQKTNSSDQRDVKSAILKRILKLAITNDDIDEFKLLDKHIGGFSYIGFLKYAKSSPMMQLLQEKSKVDLGETSKQTLIDLGFLFGLNYSFHNLIQFSYLVNNNECTAGGTGKANLAYQWAQTSEEAKKLREELDGNSKAIYAFVERLTRTCFSRFRNGKPLPKSSLDAKTIPGASSVPTVLTPLYYFSRNRSKKRYGSNYNYTIMKVLLEFGADPDVKPTPDSLSLADYMYINADHEKFRGLLNARKNKQRMSKSAAYVSEELDAYNDVMKMIGGEPYNPDRSTALGGNVPMAAENDSVQTKSPSRQIKLNGSYWHIRIDPVDPNMVIDPGIKEFWARGAYLYLRKGGKMGFNWNAPSGYSYESKNRWLTADNRLTVDFGDASYTFDLSVSDGPLTTVDNANGVLRMTMQAKSAGQK